ncbi:MAG: hypothetical protein BWY77_01048 [bacterium ADurb.Bin431]|nr:MAG: hypothetical protein BWY77_01048 [bacterium ADurb.Bin431]
MREDRIDNQDQAEAPAEFSQPGKVMEIVRKGSEEEIGLFSKLPGQVYTRHDPVKERAPAQAVVVGGGGSIEREVEKIDVSHQLGGAVGIEHGIGGQGRAQALRTGAAEHARQVRMKQGFPTGEIDKAQAQPGCVMQVSFHILQQGVRAGRLPPDITKAAAAVAAFRDVIMEEEGRDPGHGASGIRLCRGFSLRAPGSFDPSSGCGDRKGSAAAGTGYS